MHKMVAKHYQDMAPWASLSLIEIFDKIKNLPFNPDPDGLELIKRPIYTMKQIGPGGDCDDKAIAFASWAVLNSLKYNFLGVGRKVPGKRYGKNDKILLTHVFPIVKLDNQWIIADATYSFNCLGYNFGDYDRIEVLGPQNAKRNPRR